MTIVKWLHVHFRLSLITLFSSLSVKSSFNDIRSPYLSSNSKITPFVQPKPIWTSYSPPPPCPPGTLASYWNKISNKSPSSLRQLGLKLFVQVRKILDKGLILQEGSENGDLIFILKKHSRNEKGAYKQRRIKISWASGGPLPDSSPRQKPLPLNNNNNNNKQTFILVHILYWKIYFYRFFVSNIFFALLSGSLEITDSGAWAPRSVGLIRHWIQHS